MLIKQNFHLSYKRNGKELKISCQKTSAVKSWKTHFHLKDGTVIIILFMALNCFLKSTETFNEHLSLYLTARHIFITFF